MRIRPRPSPCFTYLRVILTHKTHRCNFVPTHYIVKHSTIIYSRYKSCSILVLSTFPSFLSLSRSNRIRAETNQNDWLNDWQINWSNEMEAPSQPSTVPPLHIREESAHSTLFYSLPLLLPTSAFLWSPIKLGLLHQPYLAEMPLSASNLTRGIITSSFQFHPFLKQQQQQLIAIYTPSPMHCTAYSRVFALRYLHIPDRSLAITSLSTPLVSHFRVPFHESRLPAIEPPTRNPPRLLLSFKREGFKPLETWQFLYVIILDGKQNQVSKGVALVSPGHGESCAFTLPNKTSIRLRHTNHFLRHMNQNTLRTDKNQQSRRIYARNYKKTL